MTLRELLSMLKIIIEQYDAVQDLIILNIHSDSFGIIPLLTYLNSEEFKNDLEKCSHDLDEADQLARTPALYLTYECKAGNVGICIKVCDANG